MKLNGGESWCIYALSYGWIDWSLDKLKMYEQIDKLDKFQTF